MALGYKTGGRQKGTPNKNRAALMAKLERAFLSYDPLLELVEIAQDPETDQSMRVDCHKTLASYIYPKMRTAEPAKGLNAKYRKSPKHVSNTYKR